MSKIINSLLVAGAVFSSGCVIKQPVLKHEKVVIDKGTNIQREVNYTYSVNEDEFTIIGNAVNMTSGGATGLVYGGINEAKSNYQESTNGVPVLWPGMMAGYGFLKGATMGMILGGYDGWNATYEEVQEQNRVPNQKINQFLNKAKETILFERDD